MKLVIGHLSVVAASLEKKSGGMALRVNCRLGESSPTSWLMIATPRSAASRHALPYAAMIDDASWASGTSSARGPNRSERITPPEPTVTVTAPFGDVTVAVDSASSCLTRSASSRIFVKRIVCSRRYCSACACDQDDLTAIRAPGTDEQRRRYVRPSDNTLNRPIHPAEGARRLWITADVDVPISPTVCGHDVEAAWLRRRGAARLRRLRGGLARPGERPWRPGGAQAAADHRAGSDPGCSRRGGFAVDARSPAPDPPARAGPGRR